MPVSELVTGFNVLVNTLVVISETSLSSQSLALILTTKPETKKNKMQNKTQNNL